MPLLTTDAIILHATDYLESSRILRLVTREAGVQSVVARGARGSGKRFGRAMDLFAEGQAQIQFKPGRDLHSLTGFEVSASRTGLATDLGRFAAASAVAEVVLRLVHDEAAPMLYLALVDGLDRLAAADGDAIVPVALATLWQVVAEVGFRPALAQCGECHAEIPPDQEARFDPLAGGALCGRCGARGAGRRLPPSARLAIGRWIHGDFHEVENPEARAHQRLFREFIGAYLPDSRALRAFESWERGGW